MPGAGDPVIAFGGQRVKTLLNKVEAAMRQRRFSQRPIGPLGSLLSLTDDKWAVAVETAIGKCFNDFLVANMADLDLLKVCHSLKAAAAPVRRMLAMSAPQPCTWSAAAMPAVLPGVKHRSSDHPARIGCGPSACSVVQDLMRQSGIPRNWFPTIHIVTYGLPRHNLGAKPQPPADVTTMMQVLQLPDDGPVGAAMFNFLVDFQHVEKRILVEVSCCNSRQMPTAEIA